MDNITTIFLFVLVFTAVIAFLIYKFLPVVMILVRVKCIR